MSEPNADPQVHDLLFTALRTVVEGQTLSEEQARNAFQELMEGNSDPYQTAALLGILAQRGETEEEIRGAARVMREKCIPIRESGKGLLDTCGTGGDGLGTYNISTTAAILCAAAGMPVAKHGNRSVSSRSGSADVLEKLGVNLSLTPSQIDECLTEVGIAFCFAPLLHAAMKHVVPIRKALKLRTLFNFLGPLTNPAHAEFQLIGTIRKAWAEKLARVMSGLETTRTLVVCGNNELDEIALWGTTAVFQISGNSIEELEWTASDFGMEECSPQDLQAESAEQSAEIIRNILEGQPGPCRDIAVANAAAALWTAGKVSTLGEGVDEISKVISTGQGLVLLEKLASTTQRLATTVDQD
ncbi:MAG: anthranilate phosphoribosyltransferase [Planctomycetaceae bacterium]|nr:anthranilate phosphoribosyltransferase [Planctomycetaceae bacterium]